MFNQIGVATTNIVWMGSILVKKKGKAAHCFVTQGKNTVKHNLPKNLKQNSQICVENVYENILCNIHPKKLKEQERYCFVCDIRSYIYIYTYMPFCSFVPQYPFTCWNFLPLSSQPRPPPSHLASTKVPSLQLPFNLPK